MISRILEFSLRQRALVLLAAFALIGVGIWSAWHLPVDAVPDITGVQVQVNTEAPALAAEESEKLITQIIEMELAGIPGVEEMRSITKFGLSQVTLQFQDGTDIFRARQLVNERLQSAAEQLPTGVLPKLAPISTGLGEIFYYSVNFREGATNKPLSELDQLVELSELQTFLIKPMLRTVPGVAEINENGVYRREFVVEPNPAALLDAGVTFSELAEVIGRNVLNAGGGIISRNGEQLTIRAISRVGSLEEIANLPVKFAGAVKPLLVKDLAHVTLGTKFRTGAATLDGKQAVIATTMMLAGHNGGEVAERVKKRIAEIQEKLPAGVEIQALYDRSELVGRTVGTVGRNLFEGAALVLAVLLALLGNWRGALIVACAIPLSFLFALTGMARLGISGNLMSLGAIDFGLIIDGAVVVVENVVRRLGEKQHQLGRPLAPAERTQVVLAASRQVGAPMFFGVVIITVVYIPILALSGIEGKMFHPMAMTVMLALGGALVLGLTLIPVLCSLFLRGQMAEKENWAIHWAHRIYEPILNFALRRRWVVVGIALTCFAGSACLYTKLGAEFVPTLDEGSITAMLYKPVGISLEESMRGELQIENSLRQEFPEITRVYSRIGTSDIATDPMPVNESDVYISYRPESQWPKTSGRPGTKAELKEQIEAAVKRINPDYKLLLAQPIEMRFNELLEGTKAELAVKIFGDDYDVLDELAGKVKKALEETPGAGAVEHETEGRTPQLQIAIRRDVLQRYGLQANEVNKAVTAALAGETVGTVVEGNHRHNVVVRMPEALRANDEEIKRLPVRIGDHGLLPLGKLVDFQTVRAVEPIQRDEGRRRAALMVNLNTRDIEGFVREAERRIAAAVKMPNDYFVEFGGQFENLQKARARLAIVVPTALILIFVLIFLTFGSLRQAAIVFSGIPLAVSGGVAALALRGMPFSITAAVGFIALAGVAVLNGLVLVSCFNQLREDGLAILEATRQGALLRLRPVIMTAAVASLGFIPMAIANGAGAEVQRPLATVVIGGIISSTFLTLVVLPALYHWIEREGATLMERP